METHPIVFITLKEYDNLGVGYMAATLAARGIKTRVIDLRKKKSDILRILKRVDPLLVGFSVIYQYYINNFMDLISFLRREGINCHFTAGGHYASLKYEELFEFIPLLNSIVRFEGEYTLSELAESIQNRKDWKRIDGIAYKENDKIVTNPLRPFEKDLDKFPFPLRSPLRTYAFELKFATLIAGRGCTNDCSFCNTRQFYSHIRGPVKRIRRAELVVKEMEMLYHKQNCSVFLFLDDDFPLNPIHGDDWIIQFCNELERTGLNEKIIWKINCRPDEVEEERFAYMKKNGLFSVFLGIEDGTDIGLARLNKHMTIETSINAIRILKKLNIGFDFGFMLFQPDTTFKTLDENLDFLKEICGDGYTPATFLKMMPYYETRIEKELLKEGRLKISGGKRDYDFLDGTMNHYFEFISGCFKEWLRDAEGLENTANWAGNYFSVYFHYFDILPGVMKYQSKVRKVISESNLFLISTMKDLAIIFESKQYMKDDNQIMNNYRERIRSKHDYYRKEIIETMGKLLSVVGENQIRNILQSFGAA
jgi:anaerobic magnesium-protoporphyrin IX monomethyl ester cyclase